MSVNLYNGIYRALANDSVILQLLKLDPLADNITKALRIQKRAKPQNLVLGNLPLITFYTPGGRRGRENDYVFEATFVFDVYTNDDVDLAHRISQRITALFNGEILPFMGVENFSSRLMDEHESESSLPNSYCYTTVVSMFVPLEA